MDEGLAEHEQEKHSDDRDEQDGIEQPIIVTEDVILRIDHACAPAKLFHRTPGNERTFKGLIKHITVFTM